MFKTILSRLLKKSNNKFCPTREAVTSDEIHALIDRNLKAGYLVNSGWVI